MYDDAGCAHSKKLLDCCNPIFKQAWRARGTAYATRNACWRACFVALRVLCVGHSNIVPPRRAHPTPLADLDDHVGAGYGVGGFNSGLPHQESGEIPTLMDFSFLYSFELFSFSLFFCVCFFIPSALSGLSEFV